MHKMILEFSVTDEVEVLKFSDFSLSVSGFLNCIEKNRNVSRRNGSSMLGVFIWTVLTSFDFCQKFVFA